MNVVSPLNEHSGASSGLKPTKMFFHIDHIHALSLQSGSLCVSGGLVIVSLPALITCERFLSSVDDHVSLEIVFVCETLSTLSAGETFLVSKETLSVCE